MNAALHEDQMRVTSIPYRSTKMVIFSGVPVAKNSYKTNSGKYYVTIKANPDSIPVQPTLGQHWSVKGTRQMRIPAIPDTDTVLIRTVFSFCFLCSYFYFNCPVCSSFLIDSPLNSIR